MHDVRQLLSRSAGGISLDRFRNIFRAMRVWRSLLTLFVGGLLGAAIWWLSPMVTGKAEPWDAQTGYYSLALLVAGFLAALIFPRRFWLAPIGIYLGQFTYAFLMLPAGPLWMQGLLFGVVYCLLALTGAALGFGLVCLVRAIGARSSPGKGAVA